VNRQLFAFIGVEMDDVSLVVVYPNDGVKMVHENFRWWQWQMIFRPKSTGLYAAALKAQALNRATIMMTGWVGLSGGCRYPLP
jgi:hypothetical protein